MERVRGPDETTLFVDHRAGKRGQKGPFYVVYASETREKRWGFYCAHCDGIDTAVDSMGRVECNACSNRTKAEEWDAAHE